ncbi:MAG TPA: hypothetical protein VN240_09810 [Propylenella sp.]|nr:hypothetical protein [Propylenella sp.]
MLPRTRHEEPILITDAAGEKIAVYLGQHKYSACVCGDSDGWKGLLVSGVSIELDEASLFDPDCDDAPLGAVVREGTSLNIIAKIRDNYGFDRPQRVGLVAGLPACRDRTSAGFRTWQVVLGEGEDKQVLFRVEIATAAARAAA